VCVCERAARVGLDDHEASALARTKTVHVVLIVLSILVAVWLATHVDRVLELGWHFAFPAFRQ